MNEEETPNTAAEEPAQAGRGGSLRLALTILIGLAVFYAFGAIVHLIATPGR